MTTVENGAVRQVWFAPASNPSDKSSFLIRDDAYSKREASFGRTLRLGDPVDLGPFGQWRQKNWSGGNDQELWKDEAMFELSDADVSERKGSVKLWNGWHGVGGLCQPNEVIWENISAAATGIGDDNPILFAERTRRPGGSHPGSWRLWRHIPDGSVMGGSTLLNTFSAEVQAMSQIGDSTQPGMTLIGLSNGDLIVWDQLANTFSTEVSGGAAIGFRSMAAYNDATFFTKGQTLWRRGGGYTAVKVMNNAHEFNGMCVWNNRLWFLGVISQGRTALYTSDGFTAQQAVILPGNLRGVDLCVHYGSLYIRGTVNHFGTTAGDTRQQVWKYTGSSLTLLWEDDDSDLDYEMTGGLVSWGRHLAWSKHGSDVLGREAGVWLYDAEEDAIYLGPTITMDPATTEYRVTALCVWNNTLAAAFLDKHTYTATTNQNPKWLAFVEKTKHPRSVKLDGTTTVDDDPVKDTVGAVNPASFNSHSFGYPQTTKSQKVLSSEYDAGLPGERKTWVKGVVRCRVPQGCRVRMVLLHDNDPTEHPIQTIAYNSNAGWRDVQFSATCATHGVHESSSKVRYKLYIENTDLATYPNNTAEVDVVGLDYLPSPVRRSAYHLNVIAQDGQMRLDGSANPLTTRQAIVDKLADYWEAAVPVLFWEPTTSTATPATTGIPVLMSDFLEQSFRVVSDQSEVHANIQFNLLQVA